MSSFTTTDPSLETSAPSVPGSPILGTYKRAPMEFVRGAGVELHVAAGRRVIERRLAHQLQPAGAVGEVQPGDSARQRPVAQVIL